MYGLLKAMTTKVQRALVRRQYGLIVGDKREVATTEESGSDYDFPLTMDEDPVHENLLLGLNKFSKRIKLKQEPLRVESVELSQLELNIEQLTAAKVKKRPRLY